MEYLFELIKGKQHKGPQCKVMEQGFISYFSCIKLLWGFFLPKNEGQLEVKLDYALK